MSQQFSFSPESCYVEAIEKYHLNQHVERFDEEKLLAHAVYLYFEATLKSNALTQNYEHLILYKLKPTISKASSPKPITDMVIHYVQRISAIPAETDFNFPASTSVVILKILGSEYPYHNFAEGALFSFHLLKVLFAICSDLLRDSFTQETMQRIVACFDAYMHRIDDLDRITDKQHASLISDILYCLSCLRYFSPTGSSGIIGNLITLMKKQGEAYLGVQSMAFDIMKTMFHLKLVSSITKQDISGITSVCLDFIDSRHQHLREQVLLLPESLSTDDKVHCSLVEGLISTVSPILLRILAYSEERLGAAFKDALVIQDTTETKVVEGTNLNMDPDKDRKLSSRLVDTLVLFDSTKLASMVIPIALAALKKSDSSLKEAALLVLARIKKHLSEAQLEDVITSFVECVQSKPTQDGYEKLAELVRCTACSTIETLAPQLCNSPRMGDIVISLCNALKGPSSPIFLRNALHAVTELNYISLGPRRNWFPQILSALAYCAARPMIHCQVFQETCSALANVVNLSPDAKIPNIEIIFQTTLKLYGNCCSLSRFAGFFVLVGQLGDMEVMKPALPQFMTELLIPELYKRAARNQGTTMMPEVLHIFNAIYSCLNNMDTEDTIQFLTPALLEKVLVMAQSVGTSDSISAMKVLSFFSILLQQSTYPDRRYNWLYEHLIPTMLIQLSVLVEHTQVTDNTTLYACLCFGKFALELPESLIAEYAPSLIDRITGEEPPDSSSAKYMMGFVLAVLAIVVPEYTRSRIEDVLHFFADTITKMKLKVGRKHVYDTVVRGLILLVSKEQSVGGYLYSEITMYNQLDMRGLVASYSNGELEVENEEYVDELEEPPAKRQRVEAPPIKVTYAQAVSQASARKIIKACSIFSKFNFSSVSAAHQYEIARILEYFRRTMPKISWTAVEAEYPALRQYLILLPLFEAVPNKLCDMVIKC